MSYGIKLLNKFIEIFSIIIEKGVDPYEQTSFKKSSADIIKNLKLNSDLAEHKGKYNSYKKQVEVAITKLKNIIK